MAQKAVRHPLAYPNTLSIHLKFCILYLVDFTVADLANPEFAKDKMDYLDIKDVQPGDIVAWYDPSRKVHHTGIYSGDGNYISAYGEVIKEKPYAAEFEGTTPIVRRYG